MSSAIYKKMSDIMKDIGAISKDQNNTAQGFKFRGVDQFVNALYPALTRHGVFMAPRATYYTQELREVQRSGGRVGIDKHVCIQMEYDFYAEDGSKVTVGPVPAEGLDSGDKATNKALSAALKYALIQTFSIPTEDMAEADRESPEIEPRAVAAKSAKAEALSSVKQELLTHAQEAVERSLLTKTEVLLIMGKKSGTVTDAVASLDDVSATKFNNLIKERLNGK